MPPPRPVADAALEHSDLVEELAAGADGTARGMTPALTGDPNRWRDAVVTQAPRLLALQAAAVAAAAPAVTAMFDAQGGDGGTDGDLAPAAFEDFTDGGGSWMRNLVYAPPSAYADAIGTGAGATLARARGAYVARAIVLDGIRDASRAAVGTSMLTRRRFKGWVRVLRGKSCGRCAILAGRRYFVSGFQRHPNCDCYHAPAAEALDGWETNPSSYFDSLTAAEQDALFGEAGAEAIRLGADMNQVVNARKGMGLVSAYGRDVLATTEGTTVRGIAGQRLAAEQGLRRNGRYRSAVAPRLMPDEIFQLAEQEGWSREETLRQLRRFAYIV